MLRIANNAGRDNIHPKDSLLSRNGLRIAFNVDYPGKKSMGLDVSIQTHFCAAN
jgi:hypothetical protein